MTESLKQRLKKLKKELEAQKDVHPDSAKEKLRKLDPSLAKLSDAQLSDLLRKLIGAE
jgi:hypothetical protein